ncbi:hypothetical protein [Cupriavidus oxalaticus]|uniref:hypothetical protein n=1 Tax=Cupriavidus oxalaticus TaxID=96344 RepID=UPI00403372F1
MAISDEKILMFTFTFRRYRRVANKLLLPQGWLDAVLPQLAAWFNGAQVIGSGSYLAMHCARSNTAAAAIPCHVSFFCGKTPLAGTAFMCPVPHIAASLRLPASTSTHLALSGKRMLTIIKP